MQCMADWCRIFLILGFNNGSARVLLAERDWQDLDDPVSFFSVF